MIRYRIIVGVLFISFLGQAHAQITLSSDKAIYKPGEPVKLSLQGKLAKSLRVRYWHLGEQVKEETINSNSWQWLPPTTDFAGYLVEICSADNSKVPLSSIAVDVSSDWSRFIRYGFLSKYYRMSEVQTAKIITNLNRYHINGLQFYDWQYKHQQPLGGTVENPLQEWKDIGNRDTYFSTVKQFITQAHAHNIKAMSYNLIYGALDDADKNNVKQEWYMYQDNHHEVKEKFALPEPFTSPIFLLNPADTGWQNYINAENKKLYAALDFDGYHVDQVGNRDKTLYTYQGDSIDLPGTFQSFIEAVKRAEPDKAVAMNCVNNYGQAGLAKSPANFLYTEVWPPIVDYAGLVNVIMQNDSLSDHKKQTVLTAYMNYRLADHKGYFNTSAILLTDAVISAFGGSHLELGDHMLDKEYFPQDSLQMRPDLAAPLIRYYDFLVAYENLLRGGGDFGSPKVTAINGIKLTGWPARKGFVVTVGKRVGEKEIVHLLNFKDASTLDWQDNQGIQKEPKAIQNIPVQIVHAQPARKVWMASPDYRYGTPVSIRFTQNGDKLSLDIPYLKYWNMIVIE